MENINILLLPDGNRRWATIHGTTHEYAYRIGSERIVDVCTFLQEEGFNEVWLGLARPLNLQRDSIGVAAVLNSCLYIKEYASQIGNPINIRLDGKLELLSLEYIEKFRAQEKTNIPGAFTAHILLGWSTETEIERVICGLNDSKERHDYNKEVAMNYCAIDKPIDLVIRTGTEGKGGRLSGMIPWHSTDAELFFSEELFPDFNLQLFKESLIDYKKRSHRNKM